MNPYAVASLFSAVVMAFLGTFVLMRDPKNVMNRIFMALCMAMSFWAFSEFQLRNAESFERAVFWLAAGHVWPLAIGLLMHFVIVFTGRNDPGRRLFAFVLYYAPAVLFTALLFAITPHRPVTVAWGWSPGGPVTKPQLVLVAATYLWALGVTLWAVFLCIRYTQTAETVQTRKMGKHITIGLALVVVPSLLSEIILPLVLQRPILELTVSSCAIFAAFVTYAIIKYELFPLSPVTAAESIVATISDPLFLVDLSQVIQTTNPAACRLLGFQHHELIGHPVSKVFPTSAGETQQADFARMLKTGVINDMETEFVTRQGRRIPVSLSWSMTRAKDGKVLGVTFVARDMTERRRFEESLQKARDDLQVKVEEQTRELTVTNRMLREEITERMKAEELLADDKEYLTVTLRSIADGVIATDRDGNVVLLNRVAEELTGWSNDEARGHKLSEVLTVLDEHTRKPSPDLIQRLLDSGEGVRFNEYAVLVSRDGTERIVADSAAPIRHPSGKIRGMVVVFRDVSEHRKLEERAFKTRRLESVNALAAGIAHDFNNVLTGIMTTLFMARTQLKADSETYQMLSDAEESAFKASSLTKQLLTLAKDTPPVRQRTPLREVLQEAVGYCLGDKQANYDITFADDVDEVDLDRGQIDQALSSILSNAFESMTESGALQVTVTRKSVTRDLGLPLQDGEYAVISVRDQGIGIAAENLTRVFDPYFTTKQGHSGLGLTLAYAVATKHDGCIDIESTPGTGTDVRLFLPLAPPEHEQSGFSQEAAEDTSPEEIRVLFMDDEEYLRRSANRILQHLGYEAVNATDGDEAAAKYKEALDDGRPFDIVILDLVVNGGKGAIEALVLLKQIDPTVRAIVSTGYANDPVIENYSEQGFTAALVKPYAVDLLDDLLRKVLRASD